jgi:hypothetical protein
MIGPDCPFQDTGIANSDKARILGRVPQSFPHAVDCGVKTARSSIRGAELSAIWHMAIEDLFDLASRTKPKPNAQPLP